MSNKTSAQLIDAMTHRRLVRYYRPHQEGSSDGYVLGVGPKFVLLTLLEGDMQFDGFTCVRIADIRGLQVPHEYNAFWSAALKKMGQRIPRKPRVNVDTLEDLLRTIGRAFPLLTLFRERINNEVCHIGKVVEVTHTRVALHKVGPDAVWEEGSTSYRLAEITRVDFGTGYERALSLVGGES